jgi:hypothetical protein
LATTTNAFRSARSLRFIAEIRSVASETDIAFRFQALVNICVALAPIIRSLSRQEGY